MERTKSVILEIFSRVCPKIENLIKKVIKNWTTREKDWMIMLMHIKRNFSEK